MDAHGAAMGRGGSPVAVVGGGLAGLSAAEALLRSGKEVVLIERRRELGGRASSFIDPDTGWLLDNGQHVWMPCCTELTGLLERTGTLPLTYTQPRLRVPFLERGYPPAVLEALRLPAPQHLLLPLLRFPLLRPGEAAALIRSLIRLKMAGSSLMKEGGGFTFGDWLEMRSPSRRAIDVFWEPVVTSVANEPVSRVRADLGAMTVSESFLSGRDRANLCWATVPQGVVWGRMASYLEGKGAAVRTGVTVRGLEIGGGEEGGPPALTALRLADGEILPVGGAVMTVPPAVLRRLLPDEWRNESQFAAGTNLDWAPILNVHVWYEKPVTDEPLLCVLRSPLHWIFVKPGQSPDGGKIPVPPTAQHLNLVISSSYRFTQKVPEEIVPGMLEEVSAHLPAARTTRVLAARVVHERRATWSPVPGSEDHRPAQRTPIPNLTIAGAWTATGWPSTLEGAVRSGIAAARELDVNTP